MSAADEGVISEVGAKYLSLQLAQNVGPVVLAGLIERFSTIENVMRASASELASVEGMGRSRVDGILQARDGDGVAQEVELAGARGVRILCWEDAGYPAILKHINDPPICLYVRGRLKATDAVAVAVVGARRCSHYGSEQARRFGGLLASAGFTVVSGLARGIDSCAHEAALTAGGRTLAVLGNGLGGVYPPENADLADRVAGSGALISEFPMNAGPDASHFPRRNRIIAGLTLGTLVIEAGRRSGALISARMASEYNREVFAIPGRVDASNSAGTNSLIRQGQAKLVTNLEDILDELGDVGRIMGADAQGENADKAGEGGAAPGLNEVERQVLSAMGDEESDLESICRGCGLGVGQVTGILTNLQLKGAAKRLPGNVYARRR